MDVLDVDPRDCFFWATHRGAEVDFLVRRGRRLLGFEFKHSSAPELTRSLRGAYEDLGLSSLTVVHAGRVRIPLARNIEAVPLDLLSASL